ncbi:hypothetical protein RUND412_006361 [Rhizina undulata]
MSRRNNLIVASRRRGVQDEDEEGTFVADESLTDDSGLSASEEEDGDRDDDDDGATDGTFSEDDGEDAAERNTVDGVGQAKADAKIAPIFHTGKGDNDVMVNGIKGAVDAEEVDFSEMKEEGEEQKSSVPQDPAEPRPRVRIHETPQEKRRREHEEYKKRRDTDPSFVPNRGAFFMHDHRHGGGGSNGFRPFARGGSRGGRNGTRFSGEFMSPAEPADSPWQHDMHDELVAAERRPPSFNNGMNNNSFTGNRQRMGDAPRSFGKTYHKGTGQILVNLPGMKSPITFSEVPFKVYTRLPYHRPPLRRDKPVRIALPDAPVRYIYPSPTRSFIFIPRAMRPGGSGYIRGAGRGGRGGFYGSGRSMYGGSTIYSPSVGMSRRSSLQYEVKPQLEHPVLLQAQVSGVHSTISRQEGSSSKAAPPEETRAKPIVKLPGNTSSQSNLSSAQTIPQVSAQQQLQPLNMPPTQVPTPKVVPHHPPPSYTPSVNPIPYREHRATPKIPMHQPRPQKAVNVAEIDSPAVMHFPQNFPVVYPENASTPGIAYSHSRHPSYPSQTSGTPLSQIPEVAGHHRPYHPAGGYGPQGPFYSYPPHQHPVAHMPHNLHPLPPHHDPRSFHPPPPYVPSGPSPLPNGAPIASYAIPMAPHGQQPPPMPATAAPPPPTGPTTIAQESNGMVYYSTWDPTQYYTYTGGTATAYPGTPGMSITPVPEGMINGAPAGGTVYYYPAAGTPHQQTIYYAQ